MARTKCGHSRPIKFVNAFYEWTSHGDSLFWGKDKPAPKLSKGVGRDEHAISHLDPKEISS